jgi:hypothetical protein
MPFAFTLAVHDVTVLFVIECERDPRRNILEDASVVRGQCLKRVPWDNSLCDSKRSEVHSSLIVPRSLFLKVPPFFLQCVYLFLTILRIICNCFPEHQ